MVSRQEEAGRCHPRRIKESKSRRETQVCVHMEDGHVLRGMEGSLQKVGRTRDEGETEGKGTSAATGQGWRRGSW